MPPNSAMALTQASLAMARANGTGNGAWSPLVQQIENWTSVYAPALPRPASDFSDGSFGPMPPLLPQGIDHAGPYGYPGVRRFQYPVGWNLPIGVPGTEGIKLASFQQLIEFAERSTITRTCVEMAKADIASLLADGIANHIVPTAIAEKAMQGNPAKRKDFEARKADVVAFFENPDPDNYDGHDDFFNAFLEDFFVLDAVAVHILPPTKRGAGPFGSNIAALELIDGETIRPLLTIKGTRPRAPEVAYQQYLWGVPRSDLMEMVDLGPRASLADYEALNPLVESVMIEQDAFVANQLLYLRANPRTRTPYGFGPVEQGMLAISISLARMVWQFEYFDNSSLPRVFMDPGETIQTAEEARQLQTSINQMAGDLAAMWQVIVTPPGAKIKDQQDAPLSSDFDELTMAYIAMLFRYSLPDLGMTPKQAGLISPAASKSGAQSATDKSSKRGLIPWCKKIKELFYDRIIQKGFAQTDMEWSWGLEEQGSSLEQKITLEMTKLGNGTTPPVQSIDEARLSLGQEPLGLESTSIPIIVTPNGIILLSSITSGSSDAAIEASTAPTPLPGGSPLAALTMPKPEPDALHGEDSVGDLSPAHAAATTAAAATAHATADRETQAQGKSLSVEADILTRYLKKGKNVRDFHPKVLRPQAMKAGLGAGDAATRVVRIVKQHQRIERRDRHTAALASGIASGLGGLVNGIVNQTGDPGTFHDQASGILRRGIAGSYAAGSAAANSDFSDTDGYDDTSTPDFGPSIDARVAQQGAFLAGLLAVAMSAANTGSPSADEIGARVGEYASQVTAPYEEGYSATIEANAPDGSDVYATWITEDDPCDLCGPRDGVTYKGADLPGFPGDGGFGGPVCEGAMNCRCSLDWTVGPPEDDTELGKASRSAMKPDDPLDPKSQAKIPHASGVIVVAGDTGRVLMVQRAIDNHSTAAAGKWEWPGGKLEDGDDPYDSAVREWQEEVGVSLPKGEVTGSFSTNQGTYISYVYLIDNEADVELPETRSSLDGSGDDEIENVAWWDPADLVGNPAIRLEVQASDWAVIGRPHAHALSKLLATVQAKIGAGDLSVVTPSVRRLMAHYLAGWRPGAKMMSSEVSKDSAYGEAGTTALRDWYEAGADGQITWGEPGDFDDCVAIAGQYIDDPEGYCQLRHIGATGETAGHAPGEEDG